MQKLFNCLTIVFVTIMFVSCNGKESAKQTEENVVIESDIDEITIKDIILSYDSTSFHKVFDTTEFNNCLSRMEELILELQDFHVESLADTAVLIDKLYSHEFFSELSNTFDLNPERLLHSQRVRVFQTLLSLIDELIRVEEELVSVGFPKAKTIEEDRDMIEFRDALQKTLYRELN